MATAKSEYWIHGKATYTLTLQGAPTTLKYGDTYTATVTKIRGNRFRSDAEITARHFYANVKCYSAERPYLKITSGSNECLSSNYFEKDQTYYWKSSEECKGVSYSKKSQEYTLLLAQVGDTFTVEVKSKKNGSTGVNALTTYSSAPSSESSNAKKIHVVVEFMTDPASDYDASSVVMTKSTTTVGSSTDQAQAKIITSTGGTDASASHLSHAVRYYIRDPNTSTVPSEQYKFDWSTGGIDFATGEFTSDLKRLRTKVDWNIKKVYRSFNADNVVKVVACAYDENNNYVGIWNEIDEVFYPIDESDPTFATKAYNSFMKNQNIMDAEDMIDEFPAYTYYLVMLNTGDVAVADSYKNSVTYSCVDPRLKIREYYKIAQFNVSNIEIGRITISDITSDNVNILSLFVSDEVFGDNGNETLLLNLKNASSSVVVNESQKELSFTNPNNKTYCYVCYWKSSIDKYNNGTNDPTFTLQKLQDDEYSNVSQNVNLIQQSMVESTEFIHLLPQGVQNASTSILENFTVPLEWCYAIPNSLYGVGCLYVDTYYHYANVDRISFLGSSSEVRYTFTLPESVIPNVDSITVSILPTKINNNTKTNEQSNIWIDYGCYVQNYCSASITANASGAYGSSITDYIFVEDTYKSFRTTKNYIAGAENSGSAEVQHQVIRNAGTLAYTVYVRDSRNRVSQVVEADPITILPYTNPYVVSYRTNRVNAENDASDDGIYMNIEVSPYVSAVNSEDNATLNSPRVLMSYRVKKTNDWIPILDANNNSIDIGEGDPYFSGDVSKWGEKVITIDPEKQYEIKIIVDDTMTNYLNENAYLPSSEINEHGYHEDYSNIQFYNLSINECTMFFKRDGMGIGIGKRTQTSRMQKALEIAPEWLMIHEIDNSNMYYIPDVVFTSSTNKFNPKMRIGRIWLKEIGESDN